MNDSGFVLVADTNNNRIQKFTNAGVYITQWDSSGTGNGQFTYPTCVFVEAGGDVSVVDPVGQRIQKFTPCATTAVEVDDSPVALRLARAAPNPWAASTNLRFSLAREGPPRSPFTTCLAGG